MEKLLKILGELYFFLPRKTQIILGKCLGRLLALMGIKRNTVESNIRLTGMENAKQLVMSSYESLGQLILEMLLLFARPGRMATFIARHAELKGKEHWVAAMAEGKGVIGLSSHVGNWELMTAIVCLEGVSTLMVTKKLKPEWFHNAIERGRLSCGVLGTYEPRTLKDVLKRLSEKKTVGFVLDQYAGAPVGVRVPFMGVGVGTNSVIAMLAKRTGAPVVPITSYRTGDGRIIAEISPALKWIEDSDPNREIAVNTAHYAKILEGHVRAHPEQWLWIHRRFKGELGPIQEGEWTQPRARG